MKIYCNLTRDQIDQILTWSIDNDKLNKQEIQPVKIEFEGEILMDTSIVYESKINIEAK